MPAISRCHRNGGRPLRGAMAAALLSWVAVVSSGAVIAGTGGVLPHGTQLGQDAAQRPKEVFRSQARGGRASYLSVLGDVAFNSPALLGPVAERAGISCNTCHLNGTTNPRLYIAGLATRPGTFDTTSSVFNPKMDNGVLDPLTIPSLRGAAALSPYGHDGRTASLREFLRNVVVNEFAGSEPTAEILDALASYVEDIDFIPNRRLSAAGSLTGNRSDAETRGEALFRKPFTQNPSLSCVTCHVPDQSFVDHRQHDIGSGGAFKTPTLRNANYNAPYFHDGRYDNYAQVVAYFDRTYYLGLSSRDRRDLVAYLEAIGDGDQALTPDDIDARLKELRNFAKVLDQALPEHNSLVAILALDTIDRELRDFAECFPDRKDPTVTGGVSERVSARGTLRALVLRLHTISLSVKDARFTAAVDALHDYREVLVSGIPTLRAAERWSLFDPDTRAARVRASQQLYRAAVDPASKVRLMPDKD